MGSLDFLFHTARRLRAAKQRQKIERRAAYQAASGKAESEARGAGASSFLPFIASSVTLHSLHGPPTTLTDLSDLTYNLHIGMFEGRTE